MAYSIRFGLILAGTLVTGIASASTSHAAGLDGVWNTSITLVDCSTGTALAPAFTSLLAFAGDGTESEATNNPLFQPGQRSTGYGVWTRAGTNQYKMNTYALVLFAGGGAHPLPAGSQQIHQTITLAGENFTSIATVQFFDTSGTLVASGCAKAAAQRLK